MSGAPKQSGSRRSRGSSDIDGQIRSDSNNSAPTKQSKAEGKSTPRNPQAPTAKSVRDSPSSGEIYQDSPSPNRSDSGSSPSSSGKSEKSSRKAELPTPESLISSRGSPEKVPSVENGWRTSGLPNRSIPPEPTDKNYKVTLPASKLEGKTRIHRDVVQNTVVFARHLQQAKRDDTEMFCYRFSLQAADGNAGRGNEDRERALKALFVEKSIGTQQCILTDHQEYFVSTSSLPNAWMHQSAVGDQRVKVNLVFVGTVCWSNVLRFLHSGKFPSSASGRDTGKYREAIVGIFKVMQAQKNKPKQCGRTKKDLTTVLEVQLLAAKGSDREPKMQGLDTVMEKMIDDVDNLRGLETYLRGQSVEIHQTQDDSKRTNQGIKKTIFGLAQCEDPNNSNLRPRVMKYGGGSDDVSFFLKSKPKDNEGTSSPSGEVYNRYITITEYFANLKKGKEAILKRHLPLINVGTRQNPTYIPPGFCKILYPPKRAIATMSQQDLEAFARAADPEGLLPNGDVKRGSQVVGLKLLPKIEKPHCTVGFTAPSVLAPCRLLEGPQIEYTAGESISTTSGAWKTKSLTFSPAEKGKAFRLSVLRIGPSGLIASDGETKTERALRHHLDKHHIIMDSKVLPQRVVMNYKKFGKGVEKNILEKLKALTQSGQSGTDAILVVLPQKDQPLYDYIKKQCDQEVGIQNICVTALRLADNDKGYFSQVGLKLNIKAGRQNQVLQRSKFESIDLDTTMIVGFDALFPPPKAHKSAKCIATVVASTDRTLSQWPAGFHVLDGKPHQKDLSKLLKARLDIWKDKRNAYPKNVVVYDKGLIVQDRSARADDIIEIGKAFEAEGSPKLTFIAVHKDHRAKLRTLGSFNATEDGNIPTASIIVRNHGIDNDKAWSFVLQGHKPLVAENITTGGVLDPEIPAKHATLPVHYSVLRDDIFSFNKEELENLTHDMCFLHGCGTTSVTDTLPIHYVRVLCERIVSYVRPWYYPITKKARKGDAQEEDAPLEAMTAESIQWNEKIANTMFYI